MAHKCDGCRYKGEHQEMMFRPVGVCNRGTNLVEAVQNYEAEKCPYKKTNGDRIRAMPDEELAKVLNAFTAYFDECNRSGEDISCKDCELYRLCSLNQGNALEWLKQPAEVNDV